MTQPIKIETVSDILKLTNAEFERFLPDFKLWFYATKDVAELIQLPPDSLGGSMIWTDDGKNELTSLTICAEDGSLTITKDEK